MNDPIDRSESPCDTCGTPLNRRGFVERASLMAAAALLGVGVPRRALAAMRLTSVTVLGRDGSTVSYPIPAPDGAQIDRTNEVILIRWQGVVIAFNLACPHQRAPLRWDAEDMRFECPKHHSRYTPDGSYISGRATRAMDRLGIVRHEETVDVDLDVLFKEPDNPAAWNAAQVVIGG